MVIKSHSLLLPQHHKLLWVLWENALKSFHCQQLIAMHLCGQNRPIHRFNTWNSPPPPPPPPRLTSSSLTVKSHFVLVTNANIIRPHRQPSSNFISKAHAGSVPTTLTSDYSSCAFFTSCYTCFAAEAVRTCAFTHLGLTRPGRAALVIKSIPIHIVHGCSFECHKSGNKKRGCVFSCGVCVKCT